MKEIMYWACRRWNSTFFIIILNLISIFLGLLDQLFIESRSVVKVDLFVKTCSCANNHISIWVVWFVTMLVYQTGRP